MIAFRLENANHQGDYYTGLASVVPNTCAATDDFAHQLGDPAEGLVSAALDFLDGRACTPINASAARTSSLEPPVGNIDNGRRLLRRPNGNTFERELPGSF